MPCAPGLPAVEGLVSAAARRSFRLQARSARLSPQVPLRLETAATPRVPVSSLLGRRAAGAVLHVHVCRNPSLLLCGHRNPSLLCGQRVLGRKHEAFSSAAAHVSRPPAPGRPGLLTYRD